MLLLLLLSWLLVFYTHSRQEAEYASLKQEANELYEKQIYDTAKNHYLSCLEVHPEDTEILLRLANLYFDTGYYESAVQTCESYEALVPGTTEITLLEAMSYVNLGRYAEALSLLDRAAKQEEVADCRRQLQGKHHLTFVNLAKVFPFYVTSDNRTLCSVREGTGSNMAVYTAAGKSLLSGKYTHLGQLSEENTLYPVCDGTDWFYADTSGARRLVLSKQYSYLGSFSGGYAVAKYKDRYGYLDEEGNPHQFKYDRTYPFVGSYAVAESGGTFVLLDQSFQTVTELEFDEAVSDVYGNLVHHGIILGKKAGKYRLYNEKGERIGTAEYDEIAFPQETGAPIAYRDGEKWGFLSPTGEVLIEPVYDGAVSFSEQMAAVKTEAGWGYINEAQEFIIEPEFQSATAITANGSAWVTNNSGYHLLQLYLYE